MKLPKLEVVAVEQGCKSVTPQPSEHAVAVLSNPEEFCDGNTLMMLMANLKGPGTSTAPKKPPCTEAHFSRSGRAELPAPAPRCVAHLTT